MAMFCAGETVLYGTQGVCTIDEIAEKNLTGHTGIYYVLRPVFGASSTFFVPADNEALAGRMRRVLGKEEMSEIIDAMPQAQTIWIADENQRKVLYQQIIQSGDREQLVQLIKTLYQQQQEQQKKGRRLHQCDEKFFKDAQRLLHDEIALVLQVTPEQVLPLILEHLNSEKTA